MQKFFFQPEVVPATFFGLPPKAYYAHPALLGTWCQSLGPIGRVVSEKNGNIHTDIQPYIQTYKQTYTLKTEDPIEYRISLWKSNIE